MLTLGEQDNGRRVPARAGDVVEVRLPENATTGYRWALDSQDGAVIQAQDTAANYPSAAVGSGGEAIFRFRVVGAGSASLALKSWRHWEGDKSVVQRFAVTIDATP